MKFLKRISNFRRSNVPRIYEEITEDEYMLGTEPFSSEEISIIKKYSNEKDTNVDCYLGYAGGNRKIFKIIITTNRKRIRTDFFGDWYKSSARSILITINKHKDEWYHVHVERPHITDLADSEKGKVVIKTGPSTSRLVYGWNFVEKYYRCDQFDSLQQLLEDKI